MIRRLAAFAAVLVLTAACGGDRQPSQAEIDAAVAKALETTTTTQAPATTEAAPPPARATQTASPKTASDTNPVLPAPEAVSPSSTTAPKPAAVVTTSTTTASAPKLPVCAHPSEYRRPANFTAAQNEANHNHWKTAVESQGAVYASTSQMKPSCQAPLDADLDLDKTCGAKPVPKQPQYPPNATLDQMRSINNNTRASNEAAQSVYDECQGWFYGYK